MEKNENKNFAYTTHRIGGTTYKVKVVFKEGLHSLCPLLWVAWMF